MLRLLDRFLDTTTMYKIILYALLLLIIQAFIGAFLGFVSFSFAELLVSLLVISSVTLCSHFLFRKLYSAEVSAESSYISLFILFLILAPSTEKGDILMMAAASFIMVASKYVVAYRLRHIFNPVAFSLVFLGVLGSTLSIWWVGAVYFFPTVFLLAFLMLRKLKYYSLFFSYVISSLLTVTAYALFSGRGIDEAFTQHLISWPFLFFGIIMVTEPFTMPARNLTQGIYGALVGVLSSFPYAFPPLYSSPELALILGNIFAFTVSLKTKPLLFFKEKKQIAQNTFEFTFTKKEPIPYISGQYMQWSLPHHKEDVRGTKRYFTIASSPYDEDIKLGVKILDNGSTFKKELADLQKGDTLLVNSIRGDFVLPADTTKAVVCIAGGIGITPFISMLRTLLHTKEKRSLSLFYFVNQREDIAYKDVLQEVKDTLGITTVVSLSKETAEGYESGMLTKEMLGVHIKSITDTYFYISGPPMMVSAYKDFLISLGVKRAYIVTDFFPGLE